MYIQNVYVILVQVHLYQLKPEEQHLSESDHNSTCSVMQRLETISFYCCQTFRAFSEIKVYDIITNIENKRLANNALSNDNRQV